MNADKILKSQPEQVIGLHNAPDFFDNKGEKDKVKQLLKSIFPNDSNNNSAMHKQYGMTPEQFEKST